MSTILAFDTSSALGSIALRRDGETCAVTHLDSPEGFAHILFRAVEETLAKTDTTLTDVDCFAVVHGPGPFTGLRVGITAAKGLAAAIDKPCAAVSLLKVLASFGTRPRRAPVADARRGDVFSAIYDTSLALLSPEIVIPWQEWLASVTTEEVVAAAGFPHTIPNAISAPERLAPALAGIVDSHPDLWGDPAIIDANYVRRPDVWT